MARIEIIDRADMNAEQARVYDAAKAAAARSAGRTTPTSACRSCSRQHRTCAPRWRRTVVAPRAQIVNLAVARHWSARYPWFAQVRGSLAVGIEQAVIDAINARGTPDLTDARERTCFAVARELLANKGLSDETYAAAEKAMGLEGLVALIAATGSFSMTCMTANTFGIEPPAENPTPLEQ